MNTLSRTTKFNANMTPRILFGEFGWNFCFVDTTNNTFIKSEDVTKSWMQSNNINATEFTNHCWNEYYTMKEYGVEFGLISYFSADDEKVYNYAQSINVAASYINVFNH